MDHHSVDRRVWVYVLIPMVFVVTWFLLAGSFADAQTKSMFQISVKDQSGKQIDLYAGSHALLIGVSNYTAGWPKLESVPGELKQVGKILEAQGFEVKTVMDPDSSQLKDAFENFINDYGYDQGNRLLFFFSGHGHTRKNGKKGYLVPTDAPNPHNDEKGFLRKSLWMSQILTWSRQIEAKHALFLFDSCFSGTIFKSKALPARPPYISDFISRPVRQFISAGSAGETVPAQSVFTPLVIRALEGKGDLNQDGYVTGTEMGMFLQEKVSLYDTNQHPQYGKIRDVNLDEGDFVFLLADAGAAADAPTVKSADPQGRLTASSSVGQDTSTGSLPSNGQKSAQPVASPPPSPDDSKALITKSLGMEFVYIPPGTFIMGSPFNEPERDNDEIQHQVTLSQGYYLQTTEVTQGQWERVMGSNPSRFKSCGPDCPVEMVSWEDAQDFVQTLNRMQGADIYRLPTEAEWEYAARAGTRTPFFFGDCLSTDQANYNGNSPMPGCDKGQYLKKPVAVGSYPANAWGLHDMHGNVWEWCQDWYGKYDGGAVTDPKGASWGESRVRRGGSGNGNAGNCRSANRRWTAPGSRDSRLGLRLVWTD